MVLTLKTKTQQMETAVQIMVAWGASKERIGGTVVRQVRRERGRGAVRGGSATADLGG